MKQKGFKERMAAIWSVFMGTPQLIILVIWAIALKVKLFAVIFMM